MTQLIPYLTFENTKEALEYYESLFGAKNINRMPVSAEQAEHFGVRQSDADNSTMHAEFEILGHKLYAADRFGDNAEFTDAMKLSLSYDKTDKENSEAVKQLFKKVAGDTNSIVVAELDVQFWGGEFGAVKDKYGIHWMFNGN